MHTFKTNTKHQKYKTNDFGHNLKAYLDEHFNAEMTQMIVQSSLRNLFCWTRKGQFSVRSLGVGVIKIRVQGDPSQNSSVGSKSAWYRGGPGSNPGKGENFSMKISN